MVAASGMSVRPIVDNTGGHSATVEFDPYFATGIEQILAAWLPYVFAIDGVSRAMGEVRYRPSGDQETRLHARSNHGQV
jgi:hypothetical protein